MGGPPRLDGAGSNSGGSRVAAALLLHVERITCVLIAIYVLGGALMRLHDLSVVGPRKCFKKARPASPLFHWASPHGLVDRYDRQWKDFLDKYHVICLGLGVGAIVFRLLVRKYFINGAASSDWSSVRKSLMGQAVYNALVLLYLHRIGVVFVLLHAVPVFLWCRFTLGDMRRPPRVSARVYFAVAWAYVLAFAVGGNYTHGFGFGALGWFFGDAGHAWAAALRSSSVVAFNSAPLRWYTVCNMSALRILAYVYDRWEAASAITKAENDNVAPDREPLRQTMSNAAAAFDKSESHHSNQQLHHSVLVSASSPPSDGAAATPSVVTPGPGVPPGAAAVFSAALPALPPRHDCARCLECAEAGSPCYKARTAASRTRPEYESWVAYFAAVTYLPLYAAGPFSSFNAFMSYQHVRQTHVSIRDLGVYALRIGLNVAVLEVLLHYTFISCMMSQPKYIAGLHIYDQAGLMLFALGFLWLKFNVIWKTFRLWALVDGVDVPENMVRCFANATTITRFWQGWHASFNQWIVRYMYIPLGGARTKIWSIAPIFTFVAVWHDVELHLMQWAGIMAGTFVAEVVISHLVMRTRAWQTLAASSRPMHAFLYRHLCSIGGALSTFSLILANLYGFATQSGSTAGVKHLLSPQGLSQLAFLLYLLSVGNYLAHWSLDHNEECVEQRRRRVFNK